MWDYLLEQMIVKLVKSGSLAIHMPSGKTITTGQPDASGIVVRIHDPALPKKLILNPELAVGEAYMDETLTIEKGELIDLLTLLTDKNSPEAQTWWFKLMAKARMGRRYWDQYNPMSTARSNSEIHYDLDVEFYDLWLEHQRQYTCAYYKTGDETQEQAQIDKMDHIAGKLLLKPGMSVLDIGCGWGGLAIKLARDHGVHVVGVTLSEPQRQIAIKSAQEAGVAHLVDFRLTDYRDVTDKFDRIVSVGMMEHVGQPHHKDYFGKIYENLTEDGVALIHFIGRSTPPATLNPWFHKYIFPGAYAPAFSEVLTTIEKQGLIMCDAEVLRGHYERTLQQWRAAFETELDAVRTKYDDRFIRMWRYYLVASELTFTKMKHQIFHLQIAKHEGAVPMTRDYLYARDAAKPHTVAQPGLKAAE